MFLPRRKLDKPPILGDMLKENVTRTGTRTFEKSAKGRKKERGVTHFLTVPFYDPSLFKRRFRFNGCFFRKSNAFLPKDRHFFNGGSVLINFRKHRKTNANTENERGLLVFRTCKCVLPSVTFHSTYKISVA